MSLITLENAIFQFVLPNESFRPLIVVEPSESWSIPSGDKRKFLENPMALFWEQTFVNSQPAHFLCASFDQSDKKFGYIDMVLEIVNTKIEAGQKIDMPSEIHGFLLPLLGPLKWHEIVYTHMNSRIEFGLDN